MAANEVSRHSLTTRFTHWGTVLSFAILSGTGIAIYNVRPRLKIGHHTYTLPHLPSWLAITTSPKLIHYIFAAIFVVFGIVYLVWGFRSGHFKSMLPTRADIANVVPMQLYYLRLRSKPPAYDHFNPLQKVAYTTLLFVITPLIVLSGVVLLPVHAFRIFAFLFVGGSKFWHVAMFVAMSLFVLGHLGMVISTGLVKNMRAMTTEPLTEPLLESRQ